MRIVFMGTPAFAVPCLERLVEDGHDVVGVFCQPDKPVGRGYTMTAPPVKELALRCGLNIYQPQKLRDGTAVALLRELAPELIVVVAYGRILPLEILELPMYGCINLHGSLLPKYRGAAPIQWTVINGDAVAGVTSMYMAEGMDTGDMILREQTPLGENETSGELYSRLSVMGADCLSRTVSLIAEGKAPRIPQNETEATPAPMLQKSMGKLDWSANAVALHNLVRGLNPWPGAYTTVGGKLLKLHATRIAESEGAPGAITDAKKAIVACGSGALELVTVQPEGKSRMSGADFLRGARLTDGDLLA